MPANGNIVEEAGASVRALIATLPSGFLVLVVINAVFILGLLWFLDREQAARERVLAPVLAACIEQVPLGALQHLTK